MMTSKRLIRERESHVGEDPGYEALQSMLTGEYTEESTGARTIRQTGGKDRHSKVFTSRGPRDRRVRLSVSTAIRFYDLQDRLGFEQPSKAVEWLLLHCQTAIQALPQLGTQLHSHVQRLAALPQPANTSNHIEAMELKPSQEYIGNHRTIQNHRFGQDSVYQYSQALLHNNQRIHIHANDDHIISSQVKTVQPIQHDTTQAQDSIEEELPQSSGNPSSSGASSEHPIPLSEHPRETGSSSATGHQTMPSTILPTLLCMSKRRRVQSPSNSASRTSLHHHMNSDYHASGLILNGNGLHTGTQMPFRHQRYFGNSMETESSLLGSNSNNLLMAPTDCSTISTTCAGAVNIEARPSDNYALISRIMSSRSTNLPIHMNQGSSTFPLTSADSTHGAPHREINSGGRRNYMQPMLSLPSCSAEANHYNNDIQLMVAQQDLLIAARAAPAAQAACTAGVLMSTSGNSNILPAEVVVQGPYHSMSGSNMQDGAVQQLISGKQSITASYHDRINDPMMYNISSLSPSESNNINDIAAANLYIGKAPGAETYEKQASDQAQQQMQTSHRPPASSWDWSTVKHALL